MYYKSIVSANRANRAYQVVVLFDDNDPNAMICQHTFGSMPTGHQYDPEKVYVTDDEIDAELARMGFRIVGKNAPALAWGERIVVRANSDHRWFDPRTRDWHMCRPLDWPND